MSSYNPFSSYNSGSFSNIFSLNLESLIGLELRQFCPKPAYFLALFNLGAILPANMLFAYLHMQNFVKFGALGLFTICLS